MTTDVPFGPLDFSVNSRHAREPKSGEYYYRIELADGREAVVVAETINVHDGALTAVTDGVSTLVLPAGAWRSAYMCEALMAYDPWSILELSAVPTPEPRADDSRKW